MKSSPCILVLNGGSSSIKFSLYQAAEHLDLLYDGEVGGIGTPMAKFEFRAKKGVACPQPQPASVQELGSFGGAVHKIAAALDTPEVPRPTAIGHRVVHSGPHLDAHQRITPDVLAEIERAIAFAPLHEPIALEIIHETMHHFPGVENYACFDTIFHQNMPEVASTYPLPEDIRKQGVHRYGFHGLSCESILEQFKDGRVLSPIAPTEVPSRLIIAHLGSGASVTAVQDGLSIDTTMGLTPCGGILMGTRPGDLDPGLIFYLLRMHSKDPDNTIDAMEDLLNKHSGMLALSGLANDMRVLQAAAAKGNSQAARAIEAFIVSVKKALGGYVALMGGVDAIVLTGGIGEHDASTRSKICAGLAPFGIILDEEGNSKLSASAARISSAKSAVAVYVLPAEEDKMIATHVARMAYPQSTE